MTDAPPSLLPPGRPAFGPRLLVLALLLGLVVAGLAATRIWPALVPALTQRITIAEHRLGVAGVLLAIAVQFAVALCGVLPASFGAIAAGAAYGIAAGFAAAGCGTLLGAAAGFALARSFLRPVLLRRLRRRGGMAARLDEAVGRDGWRLVCLLRISPVMPFAVTSYALGLSALRWRPYLAGTLASLPALLGYVVLGALSRSGFASLADGHASLLQCGLLLLGLAATVLLLLRIGRLVRIALRLPDLR